jgi:hypothetical protein
VIIAFSDKDSACLSLKLLRSIASQPNRKVPAMVRSQFEKQKIHNAGTQKKE